MPRERGSSPRPGVSRSASKEESHMTRSGFRSGLAATAVTSLAVAGVPFMASSASANPLTTGLGADAVTFYSQYAPGVSAENAAWLAGAGGLAGIVGKLVTGVLVDRFRANWVGGITLGFTAFAMSTTCAS